MRAKIRIAALAAVGLLGIAGLVAASAPSALAAAPRVRIRVTGIDRNGHSTKVYAVIAGTTYPPIYTSGTAVSVPKGPAWVGAEVDTTAGSELSSATLVMRRVTITRSRTITLDARPGKRVRFSLGVPGAQLTGQVAQVCVGGNFVEGAPVGAGDGATPLYVVPVRAKGFGFGYDSLWQTATASYLISGQSTGGIPSRPRYRATRAGMAKVRLTLRSGDAAGNYQDIRVIRQTSCGVQQFLPVENPTGESFTQYLSAGPYQIWTDGYRAFWINNARYAAHHSYSDKFGAAAWGPGQDFPSVWEHEFEFSSDNPISDPQHQSSECCDMSSMTLSYRGHVVKHAVQSQYREQRTFTARLPASSAAWYTFRLVAWRRVPGLKVPAGILSPRVSLSWHFRTSPEAGVPLDAKLMPVTATRFVPRGLNLQNQARPGASTVVKVSVVQPGQGGYISPPKHRLRAVRVQVSVNGGKSWRTVRLVRHGSYWLATVPDPASGGVALRSTVIDSHGNKSVETIYRAYAIG
ncbi:MAG TPA: hypothetical protein VMA72_02320 [Streptosporangiaceae bacterium]|nr:hypothetical protein [Streptosporangiaceae bacterium]